MVCAASCEKMGGGVSALWVHHTCHGDALSQVPVILHTCVLACHTFTLHMLQVPSAHAAMCVVCDITYIFAWAPHTRVMRTARVRYVLCL